MLACEVRNASELEARASRALELAVELGDSDLEARALADSGLAMQRPPVRMLDVLTRVRVLDAVINAVGPLYDTRAALGRRLRRR